jgi:probable F420-dependent oxidoreductase
MMATTAKIGLMIPGSYAGAVPPPSAFATFFQNAEELGFDALWVIDRIFHDLNILDPLTVLTHAAAVTSRVRLGTAVLLFAFRNPVLVAKTAATLDYLSGGRLTLGVSLGGRDYEFASQGIPMTQRVSRLRENLSVMRKLWTEQHVTFHGRYYHLDQVNMEPKPVQKPSIPILMGGGVDAVLKRSAEEADGWIAGSRGTPETFHQSWQKVQAYARAAGKDPARLESGKLLYIDVGEDRTKCRDRLRASTQAYYGPQYDVDSTGVFGPPKECAAKIQDFIDAGAKNIVLAPTGLEVGQLTRLAKEVIPALR